MSGPRHWQKCTFNEDDHHDLQHKDQLPFEHIDYLGRGNTSVVDKVQDKNSKAFFARKIFGVPRGSHAKSKRSDDTFKEEVRLIRKLQHRHIVRVFATYRLGDRLGLILWPAADEGNLLTFLQRYENLARCAGETDRRVEYMNRILERAFGCLAGGLQFIHVSGIRHKDIKPENILIHEGFVLYTDFGCSLDVSQLSHSISDGRGGFTEKYHPPEGTEFNGRNQFADVYSLGCVFLEMLSILTNDSSLCPQSSDVSSHERRIFVASMRRIHMHLMQVHLPPSFGYLSSVIDSMTQADRNNRPSAQQVFRKIVEQPRASCARCCATANVSGQDFQGWFWSDTQRDYYSAYYDDQNGLESQWMTTPSNAPQHRMNEHLRPPGRDTMGGAQDAESGYKSRAGQEAKKFWVIGRVFRRTEYEDKPQTHTRDDSSSLRTCDEPPKSAQKGYVVVDNGMSVVYACPVTTYSGKGTLGEKCNSSKHTIAFSTKVDPEVCYLQGERERGMTKKPIEIEPADQNFKLPKATRIRFDKTVTVSNTERAKDLGRVVPEHRARLREYWMQESEVREEED